MEWANKSKEKEYTVIQVEAPNGKTIPKLVLAGNSPSVTSEATSVPPPPKTILPKLMAKTKALFKKRPRSSAGPDLSNTVPLGTYIQTFLPGTASNEAVSLKVDDGNDQEEDHEQQAMTKRQVKTTTTTKKVLVPQQPREPPPSHFNFSVGSDCQARRSTTIVLTLFHHISDLCDLNFASHRVQS